LSLRSIGQLAACRVSGLGQLRRGLQPLADRLICDFLLSRNLGRPLSGGSLSFSKLAGRRFQSLCRRKLLGARLLIRTRLAFSRWLAITRWLTFAGWLTLLARLTFTTWRAFPAGLAFA